MIKKYFNFTHQQYHLSWGLPSLREEDEWTKCIDVVQDQQHSVILWSLVLAASSLFLVGGWATHLKNMLVKLDHFARDRGGNNFCLKPPRFIIYNKSSHEGYQFGTSVLTSSSQICPLDFDDIGSWWHLKIVFLKLEKMYIFDTCGTKSRKSYDKHVFSFSMFFHFNNFLILLWQTH